MITVKQSTKSALITLGPTATLTQLSPIESSTTGVGAEIGKVTSRWGGEPTANCCHHWCQSCYLISGYLPFLSLSCKDMIQLHIIPCWCQLQPNVGSNSEKKLSVVYERNGCCTSLLYFQNHSLFPCILLVLIWQSYIVILWLVFPQVFSLMV